MAVARRATSRGTKNRRYRKYRPRTAHTVTGTRGEACVLAPAKFWRSACLCVTDYAASGFLADSIRQRYTRKCAPNLARYHLHSGGLV